MKALHRAGIYVLLMLSSIAAWGCRCNGDQEPSRADAGTSPVASARPGDDAGAKPKRKLAEPVLTGSAIARAPDGERLFVVDEDNKHLRVLKRPLANAAPVAVELPGHPAQVVALADRVLVTIRDPGLLWVARTDGDKLVETARIALPSDAWGLSVASDLQSVLVTSAWSSQLSLVDLKAKSVRWSLAVAREPRGVVWLGRDQAYVSHLVGSELTRLSRIFDKPEVSRVPLAPAPLRSPAGRTLAASLGYALVLSPEQDRLFVARHALGALGKNAWFGAATLDALLIAAHEALSPRRREALPALRSELAEQLISGGDTEVPGASLTPFTQPRAVVYRKLTRTLLVAGEGDDRIAELDALALDPTMAVVASYATGTEYHPEIRVAKRGAAPAGLVLSEDEQTLWVYCRGTNDVVELQLNAQNREHSDAGLRAEPQPTYVSLAPDPLGPGGATGRKLFYSARDHVTSGGLACAGCHPEGRDDGFTWHEAAFTTEDGDNINFVGSVENIPTEARTKGFARRTPMLAGRVNAEGPYGWHSESPNIIDRELKGFGLHRWGAPSECSDESRRARANALADFLRRGLLPPARHAAALNPEELRGQALFMSKEVGCGECHTPETGYTTRQAYPLPPLAQREDFDAEPGSRFKIPSLYFLAGRAPYFHDGSAPSLDQLIDKNGDRMGKTSHLSRADRAALVAFLRML